MRVLLTGARSLPALCAARQLAAAGHEVFLAETIADYPARHSRAVKASFVVPPPRMAEEAFVRNLDDIARRERIDAILPAGEEALYVARQRERLPCRVHVGPFSLLAGLHDKWALAGHAMRAGVATPKTFLLESTSSLATLLAEFPTLVLKPRFGRFGRNIRRVQRGDRIPDLRPGRWLAQEVVEGEETCTFCIVHEGRILALVAYRPAYRFAWGPAYCCAPVADAPARQLAARILGSTAFTGCMGFDAIERNGELLLLDANPRMTTGLALFAEDASVGLALLGEEVAGAKTTAAAMVGPCMLFLALPRVRSRSELRAWGHAFSAARDVLWRRCDRGPFWHQLAAFPHLVALARTHGIPLRAAATHYTEWNGTETASR